MITSAPDAGRDPALQHGHRAGRTASTDGTADAQNLTSTDECTIPVVLFDNCSKHDEGSAAKLKPLVAFLSADYASMLRLVGGSYGIADDRTNPRR